MKLNTEAIKAANEKMMISSYCLGKLVCRIAVCRFQKIYCFAELGISGIGQDQLMECHKRIMSIKIANPKERLFFDINT